MTKNDLTNLYPVEALNEILRLCNAICDMCAITNCICRLCQSDGAKECSKALSSQCKYLEISIQGCINFVPKHIKPD